MRDPPSSFPGIAVCFQTRCTTPTLTLRKQKYDFLEFSARCAWKIKLVSFNDHISGTALNLAHTPTLTNQSNHYEVQPVTQMQSLTFMHSPALATGCMFSLRCTNCNFYFAPIVCLAAPEPIAFFALASVACFPALAPFACFPVHAPVVCLPAQGTCLPCLVQVSLFFPRFKPVSFYSALAAWYQCMFSWSLIPCLVPVACFLELDTSCTFFRVCFPVLCMSCLV